MPSPHKPTIIYFYEEYKSEELKLYERLKVIHEKKASFVKINVLHSPEIASTFRVFETPQLLAIDGGVEFWRYVGLFNEDNLNSALQNEFEKI